MKHAKPNLLHVQHPGRKILALHPLLQKGGVHREDDIDQQRRRERKQTRDTLRRGQWDAD